MRGADSVCRRESRIGLGGHVTLVLKCPVAPQHFPCSPAWPGCLPGLRERARRTAALRLGSPLLRLPDRSRVKPKFAGSASLCARGAKDAPVLGPGYAAGALGEQTAPTWQMAGWGHLASCTGFLRSINWKRLLQQLVPWQRPAHPSKAVAQPPRAPCRGLSRAARLLQGTSMRSPAQPRDAWC